MESSDAVRSGGERLIEAKHKNALSIIYTMSFVDLFAVGILFPFLGPHVKSLGCTDTQVGIFGSIYAALQVISGPIIGSWSDIRGRKPIFFITLVICTLLYFFMGLSTTVATLFMYRLMLGVFKHTQALNKAIIGDLTGNDKQLNTAVYGRCTAFGSMGFVVGPIVGGYLSEYEDGFQYICTLTSALFALNIILVSFLPKVEPPRIARNNDITKSILKEAQGVFGDLYNVDWHIYWGSFTLKFLFILVTTMFFTNQPVYLKQVFDAGKLEVGYVISFVSLVGMICAFWMVPISKLVYKVDESAPLRTFHAFLLLTICFLGFFIVRTMYIFAFLLLPFGVCNAALRIVTMELVFDKCRDFERGSLTGAADSVMALGRFMAPMAAGFLTDNTAPGGVMLVAAILSLLAAMIAYHLSIVDKMITEQTTRDKQD